MTAMLLRHGIDAMRIEEAGLNALQTQRQLFYDGWVVRLSPGKAKRARSVNPHFGSTLPPAEKIARCERLYAACGLPALYRITPFAQPADLASTLAAHGYVAFDPTLVQVAALADVPAVRARDEVELVDATAAEFVAAIGALRGSSATARAAHLERLGSTPLAMRAILARIDGRVVACGQVALDDDIAGIYDMATADAMQGRGLATTIVGGLLHWAATQGAEQAFLQVNEDNAPALAVYRRFGFATAYAYHYLARPHECR
jgi:N-acetylglutamate synthase